MRKGLLKSIVAAAVVTATMAVGSVCAFAAEVANTTYTFDKNWVVGEAYTNGNKPITVNGEANGWLVASDSTGKISFDSTPNFKSGARFLVPLKSTTKKVTVTFVGTANETSRHLQIASSDYTVQMLTAGSSVTINDLSGLTTAIDGTNYISIKSVSDFKCSSCTIVEDDVATATYAVSGTVTATGDGSAAGKTFDVVNSSSETVATGTIDAEGTGFSISPKLTEGTYTFSVSEPFYTISGSVTVSTADITDASVSINVIKAYTVSGNVGDVAVKKEYVYLLDASHNVIGEGKIDDSKNYSVSVPAGSYIIGLKSDTYKAAQKYLANNTVTVSTENVTLNLALGDEITEWDFTSNQYASGYASQYKVENSSGTASGTVKGLSIEVNKGKFDATNRTSAQAKNVTITVPNGVGYIATDTAGNTYAADSTGKITITDECYLVSIKKGVATAIDSTKPAVVHDGTNYYAVAVVKKATAEGLSSISIGKGENIKNTTSVYSSVTIGGTEYTAKSLSGYEGTDGYVCAFECIGDNAKSVSAVQTNGVFTFTPLANA